MPRSLGSRVEEVSTFLKGFRSVRGWTSGAWDLGVLVKGVRFRACFFSYQKMGSSREVYL